MWILALLICGCAARSGRYTTLFETPVAQGTARLIVRDERCWLRVDAPEGGREPFERVSKASSSAHAGPASIRRSSASTRKELLESPIILLEALPDVSSIASPVHALASDAASPRVWSATESWLNLLFERSETPEGDIIQLTADRPEVDFVVRYHLPYKREAVGVEVQYRPKRRVAVCSATHTIVLPNLPQGTRFLPEPNLSEIPTEIPLAQALIALASQPVRQIGIAADPDADHGVVRRSVRVRRPEGTSSETATVDLLTQMSFLGTRPREDGSLGYRFILSWGKESPSTARLSGAP